MQPGEIYHHSRFYFDRDGKPHGKYFLILASATGDIIFRPLTSQPRPEIPECHHGLPYPSFYLGVPGGRLGKKSWLVLSKSDNEEVAAMATQLDAGIVAHEMMLVHDLFLRVLECVAAADDTTFAQEQAIRDLIATLR